MPNKPQLSAIVAMTENRVIGKSGTMPWQLPADMYRFKRLSLGKPCIMGRKVWDSLHVRPLPERQNIVLTRNPDFAAPGATVVHSPEAAINAAGAVPEIAIIGGAEIYTLFLEQLDKVELTIIHAVLDGDTFMPELPGMWDVVAEKFRPRDEKNAYDLTFQTLVQRKL